MDIREEILNEIDRFEQSGISLDTNNFIENLKTIVKASVPEGFVLMPKEPTFKMAWAYQMNSVAPVSSLSVSGYKAMIEAQEPSND